MLALGFPPNVYFQKLAGFLNVFFHAPWMILGFPRSLWRHAETQPMPRGDSKHMLDGWRHEGSFGAKDSWER